MTQHPAISRQRIIRTAATVLLALPAACVVTPADAGIVPSGSVYPRAAVSSDAYRTPPQTLSDVEARPLLAADRRPATRKRPIRDAAVRPVDHQQVSADSQGYSVQAELQRLYAEEGRDMPRMAMPTYRSTTAAHAGTARPSQPRREEKPSGLLAGLFDFGRSRSSRRNSAISQPPVEPEPFRPPTYRQRPTRQPQVRRPQTRPQQPARLPQQRVASSPAMLQQPMPQSPPSDSVFELQRITPERNLAVPGDDFFPEDESAAPASVARKSSSGAVSEKGDVLDEFFPAEEPSVAKASPAETAAKVTASTAKEQLQQLLNQQAEADTGAFQMPIETNAAIIPQPAPAVASDVVTTTVTPLPAKGPTEPAPFFADAERAIDPDESMEVATLDGQTFDPSGADSKATAGLIEDSQDAGSRMQRIAARDGVGLKGYCAVALRDQRRLADGRAAYVSYYQGKAYYFSSDVAKDKFDASPAAYAPASGGEDLVMKTLTGEVIEGSLDHSVWYKGRLYLFHTAENLKTFMAAPGAMAVTE